MLGSVQSIIKFGRRTFEQTRTEFVGITDRFGQLEVRVHYRAFDGIVAVRQEGLGDGPCDPVTELDVALPLDGRRPTVENWLGERFSMGILCLFAECGPTR